MALPHISLLSIHDPDPPPSESSPDPLRKYREYVRSLPYSVEPEAKMVEMLDFVVLRLTQCALARDYEVGLQSAHPGEIRSDSVLLGRVHPMGLYADLLAYAEISHPEGRDSCARLG
jgi:hypothetical protein